MDCFNGLLEDVEYADAWNAIQAGVDKCEDYQRRADFTKVPAYTLATSLFPVLFNFS